MNTYVCFNDSDHDPTYADVHDAYLVKSKFDSNNGNPCALDNVSKYVPVMPIIPSEIISFANIMGWDISTNMDGTISLNTKVKKD